VTVDYFIHLLVITQGPESSIQVSPVTELMRHILYFSRRIVTALACTQLLLCSYFFVKISQFFLIIFACLLVFEPMPSVCKQVVVAFMVPKCCKGPGAHFAINKNKDSPC
jgi:hypothetical protein